MARGSVVSWDARPSRSAIARSESVAFFVVIFSATLIITDFIKIGLAVPFIEEQLNASPVDLQIILSGFLLAFALALPPAGRLGDVWSHKAMLVLGLCASMVGSLLCALAPNSLVLDAGRIVMGVAAGMVIAQVMGFIQRGYHGAKRGRALGIYAAAIGLMNAIAPAVGGALVSLGGETNGWRLLFWMNIPPAVALIPLALWLLPTRSVRGAKQSLDVVGLLLLGGATFALMVPFILTSGDGTGNPMRWSWLAVSVVTGVAFVRWERGYAGRGGAPILDMELMREPAFRYGLLVGSAYFAAFQTVTLLLLLYMQQGLGQAPVVAGLVTMTFTLGSALTALISGAFLQRFGGHLVTVCLAGTSVAALAVIAVVEVLSGPAVVVAIMLVMLFMGLCGGMVIAPNQTLILRNVAAAQGGLMGSIVQLFQRVGSAIGIAITTAVYFGSLRRADDDVSNVDDAFRFGMFTVAGYLAFALLCSYLANRGTRKSMSRVM